MSTGNRNMWAAAVIMGLAASCSLADPGAASNTEAELPTLYSKAGGGEADAQYQLAIRYEFGDGLPADMSEAAHWYERAARQGHVEAQVSLAWLYAGGDGVPESAAKAAFWYRNAAEQGSAVAQYQLASMYLRGEGVGRNATAAGLWLQAAAAADHADAQYALAELFRTSGGALHDPAAAAYWYTQAKEQGHTLAGKRIRELADHVRRMYLSRQVRVRAAPETQAPAIAELPAGDAVFTLGPQGQWLAVILHNKQTVGWISRDDALGTAY